MNAIAYIRVSTDEQASSGISLAAQSRKCRLYAELHDLQLVEVISDPGQSGKSLKRPGLARALSALDSGQADTLLVAKLDRLTRSVVDLGALVERYFGADNCTLMSVGENIDTSSAAGRLVLNVLVSVAQWEREAIGERTSVALRHLQDQGVQLGAAPYGQEHTDERDQAGRRVIVEVQAELDVMAQVVKLRARGLSLRAIAAELNDRGIRTQRGKAWTHPQVGRLLTRKGTRA